MSRSGVILFGHGARDPRWAEPFETVAQLLRAQQPALEVRTAFLEFMTPTLQDAGAELVAQGCTRVTVLPMFLGTGGHVRQDLPDRMRALRAAQPGVRWQLAPAIGEHATVLQAMAISIARWIDEEAAHP